MIDVCPKLLIAHIEPQGNVLHYLFFYIDQVNENLQNEIRGIALLLIDRNPKLLKMKDANRMVPLHCLFHSHNVTITPEWPRWLVSIIAPYPEALVSENENAVTPFQSFWKYFAYDSQGFEMEPDQIAAKFWCDNDRKSNSLYYILWECILMMISCFSDNSTKSMDMPLHNLASSSLTTPEIMSLGASIHHRELDRLDSKGNTPLHCACTHNRIHNASILARMNPDAARARNMDGYLPVFLALSNGTSLPWKDGLKEIVEANPDALYGSNVIRGQMYPFMLLASVAKGVCERARLEAMECAFEMIRLCPDLITTKKGREAL